MTSMRLRSIGASSAAKSSASRSSDSRGGAGGTTGATPQAAGCYRRSQQDRPGPGAAGGERGEPDGVRRHVDGRRERRAPPPPAAGIGGGQPRVGGRGEGARGQRERSPAARDGDR